MKKVRENYAESYRPVAIPLSFSRLFEKPAYKRILSFFTQNNILSHSQHGFTSIRSTEIDIYNYLQSILTLLERKEVIMSIFLDLSKTFVLINHNIVLEKPEYYGIWEVAQEWFKSYLKPCSRLQKWRYWFYLHWLIYTKWGYRRSGLGIYSWTTSLNSLCQRFWRKSRYTQPVPCTDDTNMLMKWENETSVQNQAEETLQNLSDRSTSNDLQINITIKQLKKSNLNTQN